MLNYLINVENKIINLLEILKENNQISRETRNILFTVGLKPGIVFGLAEIRKRSCLIISASGTPTYKLGGFFVPLLEPLADN